MELLDVLSQLNIPFLLEGNKHCRTGWVQLDCPFCERDSQKFHLGIPLEFGFVGNCYKCGPHSTIEILVEYTGLPYKHIKSLLSDLDTRVPSKPIKKKGTLQLPSGLGPLLPQHIKYLKSRDFKNIKELEQLWKIQGVGIGSRIKWAIFIPILLEGEVVSWTTRSISNTGLRYIHASKEQETVERSKILYGEDYVRHAVVVCEGPLDVWKIGPGAVATLGISYSKEQLLKLTRYPRRAICFDNEPVAQKRAEELSDLLSIYPGETYNITLDSKDAGSASEKELKQVRRLLK